MFPGTHVCPPILWKVCWGWAQVCSSVGQVVCRRAQCPGLHPQHHINWMWWLSLEPLQKQRQEDQALEVVLGYIRSLRPARDSKDCLKGKQNKGFCFSVKLSCSIINLEFLKMQDKNEKKGSIPAGRRADNTNRQSG